MFELVDSVPQNAVIKVIGVGGGGGNAVQHMLTSDVNGVEFICANTDAQALKDLSAGSVLHIGGALTKGLGAGANPEVGRQAAMEDRDRIADMLAGADMVFITAGMGGGTGTGAAPIVAEVAKDLGILTVAVVTRPFTFEGRNRSKIADAGIAELSEHVDSLITIPNEKLISVLGKQTSLLDAFKEANNVLKGAVQGIADLIIRPGMINVDFADVKTVMSEMGMAMMGTGVATGEGRGRAAAEAAIRCPLLEDIDLQGAKGILVNITAGLDLGLGEFAEVGDTIEEFASDNATVVVGTVIDPEMSEELKVTVVATGLGGGRAQRQPEPQQAQAPQATVSTADMRALRGRANAQVDLDDMEVPAIIRRQESRRMQQENQQHYGQESLGQEPLARTGTSDEPEYVDVPAFLRRQAD